MTINQEQRNLRKKKNKKNTKKALGKCPQKKGTCKQILTRSPKKPNSAQRKIAKIQLSNKRQIFAHIPGEGHNLHPFSVVLIRGGNVKDLPSVRYRVIRGTLDLEPIYTRANGRSKYGAKKS